MADQWYEIRFFVKVGGDAEATMLGLLVQKVLTGRLVDRFYVGRAVRGTD